MMESRLFCLVVTTIYLCAYTAAGTDITVNDVTFGSVIKLVHVQTGHRLHSHEVTYGTGSGQQSVTGFHSSGDGNSYWLVKAAHQSTSIPKPGTSISCGDIVRFQHLRTAKNLHSHEIRAPLNSDNEVSAYRVGDDSGFVDGDVADNWKVECESRKKNWQRGDQVRFAHVETGKYLACYQNLVFNNPIPQQLQVSATNKRSSTTLWKTDEGFYLAPHSKQ